MITAKLGCCLSYHVGGPKNLGGRALAHGEGLYETLHKHAFPSHITAPILVAEGQTIWEIQKKFGNAVNGPKN